METRPKRTVKRVDYRVLADVRLPKHARVSKPANTNGSSEKLYRLQVLEGSDKTNHRPYLWHNALVKV